MDPRRTVFHDAEHSDGENRYFLLGKTERGILTARFTWRNGKIRIFGAGYWRKGKQRYEQENSR